MRGNKEPYYQFDLQTHRAMENATWVLTNKESGEITEHNYREMSEIVEEGYIRYHKTPPQSTYRQDKLHLEDVRVRVLDRVVCDISSQRMVSHMSYNQILPEYNINCYGHNYQCRKCRHPLEEVKTKEEQHLKSKRLFCRSCLAFTKGY